MDTKIITFWIRKPDGFIVEKRGVRGQVVSTPAGPMVYVWDEGKEFASHVLYGEIVHAGQERRKTVRGLNHQVFNLREELEEENVI